MELWKSIPENYNGEGEWVRIWLRRWCIVELNYKGKWKYYVGDYYSFADAQKTCLRKIQDSTPKEYNI